MSKSPEDIARAFVAAINAEDPDALRALMTDDHTFTDARGNSFSGADKMRLGWQYFFRTYPNYRIDIEHTLPLEIVSRSSAKPREAGESTK